MESKRYSLWKKFIIGAALVLPLAVVWWVLECVFRLACSLLNPIFRPVFVRAGIVGVFDDLILGVFAIILAFLILCLVGSIASHRFFAKKVKAWHDRIDDIPLVGMVYSAVRQLIKSLGQENVFKEPVYIPFPARPCEAIGFVTGRLMRNGEKLLCVFIPSALSPTEGTVVFVPESEARPCDLPPEEAYKLVICGGLTEA